MGRIKTQFIKRTSQELLRKHEDSFGAEFEANKRTVAALTDAQSKKVRNIIAGYITRLVKNKTEY